MEKNYSPEEIEKIEKGRLSEEDAHELANLMMAAVNSIDIKKLTAEDYTRAEAEIEYLKNAVADENDVDLFKKRAYQVSAFTYFLLFVFMTKNTETGIQLTNYLGAELFTKLSGPLTFIVATLSMVPRFDALAKIVRSKERGILRAESYAQKKLEKLEKMTEKI